jgi:hypothetical protein
MMGISQGCRNAYGFPSPAGEEGTGQERCQVTEESLVFRGKKPHWRHLREMKRK